MKILFFYICLGLILFNLLIFPHVCGDGCTCGCDIVIYPLTLEGIYILPDKPILGNEYVYYVNIHNPNLDLDVQTTITMVETPDADYSSFINTITPSSQSATIIIPAGTTRACTFTFMHNGNPYSVLKKTNVEDSAILYIFNAIVSTITEDISLGMIGSIAINSPLDSIGTVPNVKYNYFVSSQNVDGLPTSLSITLLIDGGKQGAYNGALISKIAGDISSFVGDAMMITGQFVEAICLYAIETLLFLISESNYNSAIDPNINFTQPIIEESFIMPGLDFIPNSPLKDLEKQLEITYSHQKSLTDAFIKYQGAKEANNLTWEKILLKKTYLYNSNLYDDYQTAYLQSINAMNYLKSIGMNPDIEDANESIQNFTQNGLPDYEKSILLQSGYSNETINVTQIEMSHIPPSLIVNYDKILPYSFSNLSYIHLKMLSDISLDLGNEAPPFANFTVNNSEGKAPLTVQFNDSSLRSPLYWYWDFGDGNYSTIQNVTHTYYFIGNYSVNLTVTNTTTGSDTRMKYNFISVTSNDRPVANFTANPISGVPPLNVTFTDISSGLPSYWNWDFGDGNYSTIQNVTHTYYLIGNYSVNLTVTNITTGNDTVIASNLISVINNSM